MSLFGKHLLFLLLFSTYHSAWSADYDNGVCENEKAEIENSLIAKPGQTLIVNFLGRPLEDIIEDAKSKTTLASGDDHTAFLFDVMEENANSSQFQVLSLLEKRKQNRSPGGKYKQLWGFNMLLVYEADVEVYRELIASENVDAIDLDEDFFVDFDETPPVHSLQNATARAEGSANWNVEMVKAPLVWDQGYRGQGVVVGIIDSGVLTTHDALKQNYRREYGWLDALYGKSEPYDDFGHGTHVAGTAVGGFRVGVAPEAEFIACKCLKKETYSNQRSSQPSKLVGSTAPCLTCLQWMLCPEENGRKDCSKRPKVINCSWGFRTTRLHYDQVLDSLTAAGTIHVFAIGNFGPDCFTLGSPGDRPKTIGVGAVDRRRSVLTFSARGPAPDGSIKPDISAPGVDIISCSNTGPDYYNYRSGTSMAAPHVAGIAALIASKDPGTNQAAFKHRITKFSDPHLAELTDIGDEEEDEAIDCGGDGAYPNNHVGWGLANAFRALLLRDELRSKMW